MAEFRWIIMSSFLMLLFSSRAANRHFFVKVGDDVTLPCKNKIHDQNKCYRTTWLFSDSRSTETMFEFGWIHSDAKAKSDRLSVTENCSVVIKKVTEEDAGQYTCSQFTSGKQDSQVILSVLTVTSRKRDDAAILSCSVSTHGRCKHTVKWLYDSDENDLETSQSACSANVTFTTSQFEQKWKYYSLLTCSVMDGYSGKVRLFAFSPPQSSAANGHLFVNGDDVTLPCKNKIHDQNKCYRTTWLFSDSRSTETMFEFGWIHSDAKAKSDRLSVTKNCSVVIKKVTEEDAGQYTCSQFTSGKQDSHVILSVLTVTSRKRDDAAILSCSVSTHGRCKHTVKWLYDSDKNDLETSQSACSANVKFTTSQFEQKWKYYSLLTCSVMDGYSGKVRLFAFSPPQSSGFWRFIHVPLGLAALIITVVAVNMWTRTKGNKTQTEENTQQNDEDEDEGTVNYENVGEPSASVRLH